MTSIAGLEKYLIRYLLPGFAFVLLGGLLPAIRFRPDDVRDITLSQIAFIVLASLALGFMLDALQTSKLIPGRSAKAKASQETLQRAFGVSETTVRVLRDVARTHFTEKQDAIWSERSDRAYMALNLALAASLFSIFWLVSIGLRLMADDGSAWVDDDLNLGRALLFENVGLYIAADGVLFSLYVLVAIFAAKSGLKDLETSYDLFRTLALTHKDEIRFEATTGMNTKEDKAI